jgi:predicted lipoprotein with Yx(FWY)xxD motif
MLLRIMPVLVIGGLNSCTKNSNNGGGPGYRTPPTPPIAKMGIQITTSSQFGSVITDDDGNTLYFFAADVNGNSACTGACLTTWPVFYIASPFIGGGLEASDFSSILRPDGAVQLAYKGWPLYKYAKDVTSGNIKGDGVNGLWFVAKPDYTIMLGESQLLGDDGVAYDSTYHAGTGKTTFITDDRGLTLYTYTADRQKMNNYTLPDFSNNALWPIVQKDTVKWVPSTLDKSAFSYTTVFDRRQLTYKGWPVYMYGFDDLKRGNTKGVSVTTPGTWPVMNQFSAEAPQ